jgi:hypothetical protein
MGIKKQISLWIDRMDNQRITQGQNLLFLRYCFCHPTAEVEGMGDSLPIVRRNETPYRIKNIENLPCAIISKQYPLPTSSVIGDESFLLLLSR